MTDHEKLLRRTFAAHEPRLDSASESEMFARIAAAVTGGANTGDRDGHDDTGAGHGLDHGDNSGSGRGEARGGIADVTPIRSVGRPYPQHDGTWTPADLSFTDEQPKGRRFWWAGAAAGIVLATAVAFATIALPGLDDLVGTRIGPTPTMTAAPMPTSTPTDSTAVQRVDWPATPGPLTREQAAAVLAGMDEALRAAGTLRVTQPTDTSMPDPMPPIVYEIDVRHPTELRLQTVNWMIHIGPDHWVHEVSADDSMLNDLVWVQWREKQPLPPVGSGLSLLPFQWEYIWLGSPEVVGTDHIRGGAEVIGTESIKGVPAIHYRFTVELGDGMGGPTMPTTLDTWVAPDGKVVQAGFNSNPDASPQMVANIEYGVDVSIQPPPPGEVELSQ